MEEVYAAIQNKNQTLTHAFREGDAATVAAVYAEDAVLMPPNNEMFQGRPAIEAFWRQGMGLGFRDIQFETLEVEAREDVAYELGRYRRKIEAVTGNTVTHSGKYITVWRRTADGWQPQRDIWNGTGGVDIERAERSPVEFNEPAAAVEDVEDEAVEAAEVEPEPVYEEQTQVVDESQLVEDEPVQY